MEKKLSEITRNEWIAFQWIDTTQMGDTERIFMQGFRRTPDEAAQVQTDWDETAEARGVAEEEGAPVNA